ncbi:MAG: threonine aldolase family protein [Pseudomonadota bacterium]
MHNFYSDTQTLPTQGMREAAVAAPLGDEQRGEDPTTRALEERVADLLGKEAAVFLPSGTMCNEIALGVHCRPGDEVICERVSHIVVAEGGGPAALWGVMIQALDGERGMLAPDHVAGAIRGSSRYAPASRLLSVEQTANLSGGTVWPVERLTACAEVAKAAGLATHMDGARLMNAVVASGRPARDHAEGYDSAWIDLSKGLGCPVGAALAGNRDFIQAAWRLKQRIGGALRQSGMLTAMGLYALDHHVDRLAEDHALARDIARRLSQLPIVARVLPADSNIVILDLTDTAPTAAAVVARLEAAGVRTGVFGTRRIRIVTHLDVGPEGAKALCDAFARIAETADHAP